MTWLIYAGALSLFVVAILGLEGRVHMEARLMSKYSADVILAVAAIFYIRVFIDRELTSLDRRRTLVLVALFIGAALFWSGFEQAGSSLNRFAERYTARNVLGIVIPAEAFQSLNAIFILLLAPFFSALWINLGRRNMDPSIPLKFALGFFQLGLGFAFMWFAASLLQEDRKSTRLNSSHVA